MIQPSESHDFELLQRTISTYMLCCKAFEVSPVTQILVVMADCVADSLNEAKNLLS